MKTICTIFGGLGEIGGNKVVITSGKGSSLLLDFGIEFRFLHDFFDNFLQIRRNQALFDGVHLGYLPLPVGRLQGIYREDLLSPERQPLEDYFHSQIEDTGLKITHVAISHCHSDHIGLIRYLHPEIGLICGNISRDVLEYYQRYYKTTSNFNEVLSYAPAFQVSSTGTRMNSSNKEYQKETREVTALESGQKSDLGGKSDFNITFYETDHSIPGAGAFILQDKHTHKIIVYTGDIRFHGPTKAQALDFVAAAKAMEPDLLITEGTRLGRVHDISDGPQFETEEEVADGLYQILTEASQDDALCLFTCPMRDAARLESFYYACKQSHRQLVLLPKSYLLLEEMVKLGHSRLSELQFHDIGVFVSRKGWGLYEERDYSRAPDLKTVLFSEKVLRAEDFRQEASKFCLQMSFYNLNDLFDIRPPSGAYWIRSESEPFNDEGELRKEKLLNWLSHFGIPAENVRNVHCSGHMKPEHMEYMIKAMHPKKLVVIHSEHPDMVKALDLAHDIDVLFPEIGEDIEI